MSGTVLLLLLLLCTAGVCVCVCLCGKLLHDGSPGSRGGPLHPPLLSIRPLYSKPASDLDATGIAFMRNGLNRWKSGFDICFPLPFEFKPLNDCGYYMYHLL